MQDNNLPEYNKGGRIRLWHSRTFWLIITFLIVALGLLLGIWYYIEHKRKLKELSIQEEIKRNEIIFYDFSNDGIIVNLDTRGKGMSFMKLKVAFQIKGTDNLEAVKKWQPKIMDVFQTYLRELRPSDLQGSLGLYRLREELTIRINTIIYPAKIEYLIFKDIMIQ